MEAHRRWRQRCTLYYCISFAGLACGMCLAGPTLTALSELYATSSSRLAPMFIFRGAGYGIGTVMMGQLLDSCPKRGHVLLALSSIVLALALSLVPHAHNFGLPALFALTLVFSIAGGCVDLGGNVLIVWVWGTDRMAGAAMNLLHFSWGVGAAVAPLIAGAIGLTAGHLGVVYGSMAILVTISGVLPLFAHTPIAPGGVGVAKEAAEVETGLASAGESRQQEQQAWASLAEDGHSSSGAEMQEVKEVKETTTVKPQAHAAVEDGFPRAKFARGIVCMFCYYFCYAAAEKVPGDWLATVATSMEVGGSVHDGAQVTAAYWGALTGGRLLAVALASIRCCDSGAMIGADFLCCVLACAVMLVWGTHSLAGLYAGAVGVGLGLASLYPSGIILAQTRLPLTGKWISRFIVGGTIGSMVLPALIGMLMSAVSTHGSNSAGINAEGGTAGTNTTAKESRNLSREGGTVFALAELMFVLAQATSYVLVAAMPLYPLKPPVLDARSTSGEIGSSSSSASDLITTKSNSQKTV